MSPEGQEAPAAVRSALLVIGGAVLWGTTGTAQALGPSSASPIAVGTTRLVAGGVLLALLAGLRVRAGGRHPRGQDPRVRVAALTVPALLGAVGVAAYQLTFFAAVDRAGVAVGTTVAIGSSPLLTGLIEWTLTRRAPARRWWAATAVGISGLTALGGAGAVDPRGLALALGAGLSYAVYATAAKRLLDLRLRTVEAMGVIFGGGAILLAPGLVVADLGFLTDPAGLVMLAWLAVATVLLSYVLFAAGLQHLPASSVATLSLAEPLTAAFLGVVLLGEALTPLQAAGVVLLIAALVVLGRAPRLNTAIGSPLDDRGPGP